jgi:hypothetical protein
MVNSFACIALTKIRFKNVYKKQPTNNINAIPPQLTVSPPLTFPGILPVFPSTIVIALNPSISPGYLPSSH